MKWNSANRFSHHIQFIEYMSYQSNKSPYKFQVTPKSGKEQRQVLIKYKGEWPLIKTRNLSYVV